MDGSVLEEKSFCKVMELTFPSKLYWGSYINSIAKFICLEVNSILDSFCAVYFYKFTNSSIYIFFFTNCRT